MASLRWFACRQSLTEAAGPYSNPKFSSNHSPAPLSIAMSPAKAPPPDPLWANQLLLILLPENWKSIVPHDPAGSQNGGSGNGFGYLKPSTPSFGLPEMVSSSTWSA